MGATRQTKQSFWRILRQVIDAGLPMVGVCVTLAAVLYIPSVHMRVGVVVLGLLMIETGVWKMAHQLLPSERRFHALRAEGEHFLLLLRHLNEASLALKHDDTPENRRAVDTVRETMHQSVERMSEVAGKTDTELGGIQQTQTSIA